MIRIEDITLEPRCQSYFFCYDTNNGCHNLTFSVKDQISNMSKKAEKFNKDSDYFQIIKKD
jgi:hypothetical protein